VLSTETVEQGLLKVLVTPYQTTRCHKPEVQGLSICHHKNMHMNIKCQNNISAVIIMSPIMLDGQRLNFQVYRSTVITQSRYLLLLPSIVVAVFRFCLSWSRPSNTSNCLQVIKHQYCGLVIHAFTQELRYKLVQCFHFLTW